MTVKTELKPELRLFWALFAAWIISFLVPAARSTNFPNGFAEVNYGFQLAFISIVFIWIPYFGQLWIVNICMALAPVFIKRARQGKGGGYLGTLAIGAMLPLPLLFIKEAPLSFDRIRAWLPGFYLWQGSLLGMALWFFLLRSGYLRNREGQRAAAARPKLDQLSVWTPWR